MQEIYRTKTLVGKAKTGKIQYWYGASYQDGERVCYRSYSWQHGGKMKESAPVYVENKNVGKTNETSLADQAKSEIESKLNTKIDGGYEYEDGTPVGKRYLLPTLAKPYDKAKKKMKFTYPCFVQYKYDGVRCLHDGNEFWSRKGKPFMTADHLRFDTNGWTLDGELMLPRQDFPFEMTTSAVSQVQELNKHLIYIIYDCYKVSESDMPYNKRLEYLQSLQLPPGVSIAPTETIEDEDGIRAFQSRSVAEGYEGTMIRNRLGKYLVGGYRSDDLLKYKDFIDMEYKIVGFEDGKGKESGAILFICAMPDGKQFTSRPKGSYDIRREWYRKAVESEGACFIGKELTVRYQELSEEGIPRFNVGIAVRDYE